jgi:hypothetical protein|tara:strand:- start:54 stop:734 length:681 start_codon:yes stop_codon:yes gene_type:complete
MPNYSQGKIYSIRSYLTDDVYYGSTCQKLSDRLAGHKKHYKRWLLNKGRDNYSSFRIFEKDIDAYIELVENYSCNSRIELCKKEGEVIRANVCVNKCIAGRTIKEWYKDNKEQILEQMKQYNQNNKEVISKYNKQYRQDNKEELVEFKQQWYQDNKEVILVERKQHYQNNKEVILEQQKQYNQDNKEIIAEKAKVKYTCECGSTSTIHHKSRHEKTKKHQSFINSN